MQRMVLLTAGLLLSASLSLSPRLMSAQTVPAVILSEVAWAGSSASAADEWIELHNTTDQAIDLSGWMLTGAATSGGALTLPAGSTIGSHSTFLIANYDAEHTSSTLGITAGFVTSSLSLSNSGQNLVLQNGAGAAVDAAGSGGAPFAGTSGGVGGNDVLRVYASMERTFPVTDGTLKESWATASTATGFDAGVSDLGTPGTVATGQSAASEQTAPSTSEANESNTATESVTETPATETAATSSTTTETISTESSADVPATATDNTTATSTTESSQSSEPTTATESTPVEVPTDNQTSSSSSSSSSHSSLSSRGSTTATIPLPTSNPPIPSVPVPSLALSEIYPNTEGDDAAEEFIELINMSSTAADLKNWSLEDAAGKRYTQTETLLVAPGGFMALPRATTKITLNNTNELVRLIRADGRTVDEYAYDKSLQGQSVARINGNWVWTEAPTPNTQNRLVVSPPAVDETPRKTSAKKDTSTSTSTVSSNTAGRSAGAVSGVSIHEAQSLKDGARVKLSGTVLVEPGVLGKQIFYVSDGTEGIQVYKNDAVFPSITRTDRVELTGTLSTTNGARRVKVGAKDEIRKSATGEAIAAQETSVMALKDAAVGSLVRVSGVVLSRSATSATLEQDGAQTSVRLASGAHIDAALFERGADATVAGILTKSGDQPQVSPRDSADIASAPNAVASALTADVSGKELQQERHGRAGLIISIVTAAALLGLALRKWMPHLKIKYGHKPLRFTN